MRVAETIGEVPQRKPVEQNPEEGRHFHEQRKREAREGDDGKTGRYWYQRNQKKDEWLIEASNCYEFPDSCKDLKRSVNCSSVMCNI